MEGAGHITLFNPKFHPEMNRTFDFITSLVEYEPISFNHISCDDCAPIFTAIERLWSGSKYYARAHCEYNIKALRKTVPLALKSVTLKTLRRYVAKSLRYFDIYEEVKCNARLAEIICQKYKSHRRVLDDNIWSIVEKLINNKSTSSIESEELTQLLAVHKGELEVADDDDWEDQERVTCHVINDATSDDDDDD